MIPNVFFQTIEILELYGPFHGIHTIIPTNKRLSNISNFSFHNFVWSLVTRRPSRSMRSLARFGCLRYVNPHRVFCLTYHRYRMSDIKIRNKRLILSFFEDSRTRQPGGSECDKFGRIGRQVLDGERSTFLLFHTHRWSSGREFLPTF